MSGRPPKSGLYEPAFEHEACGVGFVAHIDGHKSHEIIEKGMQVLINLTHRGAVGSDPDTGDGAGLLFQIPDNFFRTAAGLDFPLPDPTWYAVGMAFLPIERFANRECIRVIEEEAIRGGSEVLGWRDVPTDPRAVGPTARTTCPVVRQVFLGRPGEDRDPMAFERRLYLIRRRIEKHIGRADVPGMDQFHMPSLSARTIVYKGMMLAHQVPNFYPDLVHPDMTSALVVVHQRYSTNTFPTWSLAHPFRYLAHNGEINTLRGNINNMQARYATLNSEFFGDGLRDILPIFLDGSSDSACFDSLLELLHLSGRSLPHALMMMVPEAWGTSYYMGNDRRAFYEYHAMFIEPWDGPAALVCSDGTQVCATLDRNGLRPARWVLTKDGLMVLASEVGVLDFPPEKITAKGRLGPGKMILVDTAAGRVLGDEEIKAIVCRKTPYRRWLAANRVALRGLFDGTASVQVDHRSLLQRQQAFGYSREDLDMVITAMARDGKEPVGSMGDDTPLAVLSDESRLLFDYFKQLFAQVTNPAIDPIREELVMSLTTYIGRQGNLLEESPDHARMLKLATPILTSDDLARIRASNAPEFRHITLDMVFPVAEGAAGLAVALDGMRQTAEQAARDGYSIIILRDSGVSDSQAPIPSLLAVAAVNRHLVRTGLRTSVSIIVESGEPREVMHFALLLGYGATAVNPYLALETTAQLLEDGRLAENMTVQDAVEHYIKATEKGLLKIFSKMGISTLRSYRGAQIFEALGLSQPFIDEYFPNTPSRIGGIELEDIAREALDRHAKAFKEKRGVIPLLSSGGKYSFRRDGERHMWTPDAIRFLQQAVRTNRRDLFDRFSECINDQNRRHCTLRSLFDFKDGHSIPLGEVEPADQIVRRFVTGAMSFGSISREAHETIAIAMNRLGGRSNSGEGGEDRTRYIARPNGDNLCSSTKQVASGRFGVTTDYLINAREIQVKIAQGAKPGEGGQLPGHKVNSEIARVRHSTPGVSLISPPPHHDIYSIEDLSQLIFDLKNVNPEARISVKLVSEVGVGTVAAGVAKAHADMVLISGGDGGTGASPLSSIKHAGVPWELGLSEAHQVLVMNDLRSRIRVQTDGQIRTGRDVAVAALLGAEEFGFATAPLVVLGCVMMRKCHQNTCPAGVATQDPQLRSRFQGRPDHLLNYFYFVAEELRETMARLGFRTVDEMVGRADMLRMRDNVDHWKARKLDFTRIFHRMEAPDHVGTRCLQPQNHHIDDVLDRDLIAQSLQALEFKRKVAFERPIRNVNRAVGAMLSGEIVKRHGYQGLQDDAITLTFHGSAGQSFGAFGMKGLTLVLWGDSNDYIGKGLSGAKIVVRPPEGAAFVPEKNAIIGNVALYGATKGEAYFSGLAGERFAIRNSGATAVVEGVGDHGCEYMTGGVVVVLGRTGVNFAAGMSGGIAYVYDPLQDFDLRCNLDMVDIEPVIQPDDQAELHSLISRHHEYTGSPRAAWMLTHWEETLSLFVKVIPMEYRRALGQMASEDLKSRRTAAEMVQQA